MIKNRPKITGMDENLSSIAEEEELASDNLPQTITSLGSLISKNSTGWVQEEISFSSEGEYESIDGNWKYEDDEEEGDGYTGIDWSDPSGAGKIRNQKQSVIKLKGRPSTKRSPLQINDDHNHSKCLLLSLINILIIL